uniref:Uncharacterized protein n=1 Tax=Haptolina ericina TaxID=156174 RepID=A0A7S3FBE3_9EUKA|eukprot:CAMPEP_0181175658 /NCGR_PEP_ID=MMETSP1096-20121128/4200_1 /TAXON_ID=156174 ORGANISM="Chrysochromulina ericina, Strain CCMP281" /NCGR_SAMPLE_ID=MMETSP1096 /ASSEMBLY_ACC=CAM_ASM_000453 /LENGTH=131 /DNA_ID=CAMNT_0023263667 /DNA_START=131 /DNA_END=526 /DNA_ORIENTATION=+
MAANAPSWQWASEQRKSVFRNNSRAGLACFAGQNKSLPHVVVSDSASVTAEAADIGMLTTAVLGEHAIHLAMSSTPAARDVERLFADWWLLASAADAYHFDRIEGFLTSARIFAGREARNLNGCLQGPRQV